MTDVKPGKRARTRDQILIAAQEILMERGAQALTIKTVAERAGLVHASFYNYYPDTGALLDGLADLLLVTHAATIAPVRKDLSEHALLFAATTRQTLRLIHRSPRFAGLLFDSGIAADRLLTALHDPLRADLRSGAKSGEFSIDEIDVAVTIVAGSMLSLAIDLYRGRAKPPAIDAVTFQLLRMLGVGAARAKSAAFAKIVPVQPPPVPLSWAALGLAAPENAHAA